jgi:hypothetical protein
MLDWAGVAHPALAPAGVEIRTMQSGNDRITIAFNHNDAPADVALSGVDVETGAAVTRKMLEPEGVWIVRTTLTRPSATLSREGETDPQRRREAAGERSLSSQ